MKYLFLSLFIGLFTGCGDFYESHPEDDKVYCVARNGQFVRRENWKYLSQQQLAECKIYVGGN